MNDEQIDDIATVHAALVRGRAELEAMYAFDRLHRALLHRDTYPPPLCPTCECARDYPGSYLAAQAGDESHYEECPDPFHESSHK